MKEYLTLSEVADILGKSKETIRRWDRSGKLTALREPTSNYRVYHRDQLKIFDEVNAMQTKAPKPPIPGQQYNTVELFAGAGGLALGLEHAGLHCELLNEIDKHACATLRRNRPDWNIIEGDIANVDFTPYQNEIDVVTGGFPCQAFSYGGKKLGFNDARGTLFYEFARAVKEIQPLICMGENVRGLQRHDGGKTLSGMINILDEIGYRVLEPKVLKAIFYEVPQKRERIFIVGIRKDIAIDFVYPNPISKVYTVKDALKKGGLYEKDVPQSAGATYPEHKKEVMDMVPPGGYWRDLPEAVQKDYMKKSYYLGGGKTGMARRISWHEPCLTLTTSPAQKQTERCHPDETRPFTIREYARIQTFPDEWRFSGSVAQQYKQIGNAVPVNLGKHVGYAIVRFLNEYYSNSFSISSANELIASSR